MPAHKSKWKARIAMIGEEKTWHDLSCATCRTNESIDSDQQHTLL
jgi:hypothetical protein